MDKPSNTSVKFTPEEEQLIDELGKKWRARSKSETIRRSVAQASALRRLADKDGNLTAIGPDGEKIVIPLYWGI